MYFICSSVSSSSFFSISSLTLPFLLYCGRFAAPFALPLLPILNAGQQRRRADKNEHVKTLLLLLLVVVLAVVVVDLIKPHVGWIRYGLAQQAAFVQSTTRAVVRCALPWWVL